MHLNIAVAAPVEAVRLNDRLTPDFITMRPYLLGEKCGGEYICQEDKPFKAYEPPAPAVGPPWMNWLIDAGIYGVLGLAGFAFYWLVLR